MTVWSQQPLPGLQISWNQPTPGGSDIFTQYNVKRRLYGTVTDPWVRIAVIFSLAQLSYTDYTVQQHVDYEYSITWTVNRAGAYYESADTDIGHGNVRFVDTFLHDATPGGANAIGSYVQLKSNALTIEPKQAQALLNVWGRAAPTVVIGTALYRHITYKTTTQDPATPQMWNLLTALQQGQQSYGAPLCFRTGHMSDRAFVVISKLSREDPPYEYLITVEFDEIALSEAV